MNIYVYFLILVSIRVTCADILTDSLSRIQQYDNKIILPAKLLATKNARSLSRCAAYCNSNEQCLSLQYGVQTNVCRLISERLTQSLEVFQEESNPDGWKYYESKIDCSKWHMFNNHMYKVDNTLRNFTNAQAFCASQSKPSYVIEIESEDENDWFLELVQESQTFYGLDIAQGPPLQASKFPKHTSYPKGRYDTTTFKYSFGVKHMRAAVDYCGLRNEFWINLNDPFNFAPYTWLESGRTANYTKWGAGSPSHWIEQCVASFTDNGGYWNDIYCGSLRPVVCERNV